jgi:cytochrome c oxidase subunit 1
MAASVLLGGFAGIYFWFPKMFGKMMNETMAKIHFWGTMIPLNGVFFGMLMIGYGGMHRRIYNPFVYDSLKRLIPINEFITTSAILMGAFQIVFVINFLWSLYKGPKASSNPWEVGTLEWTIPSPPVHHNYDVIPVVKCGPHEFGNPNLKNGRDFQYQTEELVEG